MAACERRVGAVRLHARARTQVELQHAAATRAGARRHRRAACPAPGASEQQEQVGRGRERGPCQRAQRQAERGCHARVGAACRRPRRRCVCPGCRWRDDARQHPGAVGERQCSMSSQRALSRSAVTPSAGWTACSLHQTAESGPGRTSGPCGRERGGGGVPARALPGAAGRPPRRASLRRRRDEGQRGGRQHLQRLASSCKTDP